MRKIVGAALATCGLIVVLTAIALATVWKPSGIVTAQVNPGAELVRTAPGVLELVDTTVTITATDSADADITLAFGTAVDTGLWAEGLDYVTITGLTDWETLSVAKPDPVDVPSETPSPAETATAVETPAAEQPPVAEAPVEEVPAEEVPAEATPAPEEVTIADILAVSDMWTKVEQGTGSVARIGGVHLAAGQVPDQPAVHCAKGQFTSFGPRTGARHLIEQPFKLGG